jgi:hypothetical protein
MSLCRKELKDYIQIHDTRKDEVMDTWLNGKNQEGNGRYLMDVRSWIWLKGLRNVRPVSQPSFEPIYSRIVLIINTVSRMWWILRKWLRLALSKAPNRVVVFPPRIWGRKQIQLPKRRVLFYFEFPIDGRSSRNPAILINAIVQLFCHSTLCTLSYWQGRHMDR